MSEVTVTTKGFTIHAKDGAMLAYAEHIEDALPLMRGIDEAESVRRVSDNALVSTKYRLEGESFWSALWNGGWAA